MKTPLNIAYVKASPGNRTTGMIILVGFLLTAMILLYPPGIGAQNCIDLDDMPLDIKIDNTPPNILFVIDDSGSMDWEFMTDWDDGKFHDEDNHDIAYLYNSPDNYYSLKDTTNGQVLGYPGSKYPYTRADYRATFHELNKIYFNPRITYKPWPKTDGTGQMAQSDTRTPKYHPYLWEEDEENAFPLEGLYKDFYAPGIFLIDDGDDGYSESKKNNWKDSASERPYDGDSRYTTIEGEYAAWTHDFTSDSGTYQVQAWWSCFQYRDEHAQFTISHDDGDTVIEDVNQRSGSGTCGEWVTLGSLSGYAFSLGTTGTVTVKRTAAGNGSSTVADAVRFIPRNHSTLDIINAHYYVKSDAGDLYLVNLKDPVEYYQIASDHANVLTFSDFTQVTDPPSEIEAASFEEARQNFANWFTYYRRRSLLSIAAISEVISEMSNVYMGIAGINATRSSVADGVGILEPVLPIDIDGLNYSQDLLSALYNFDQITGYASTPMRDSMVEVWQYFNRNSVDNDSNRGQGPQDKWRCSELTAAYPSFYPSGEDCEPISGIKGSCQQNFVVLFTDGYYNGGAPGIQNIDGTVIETEEGVILSGIPPFADSYPNTLSDVAMKAYAYDLAPDIDDEVPTSFPDLASHQHLVTHVITFGVYGNLDPEDYPTSLLYGNYPEDTCPDCPVWPGINSIKKRIDDMYHATVNGRGVFKSASNPEELVAAFKEVVESILDRVGIGASAAVNGQELHQGSELYLAGYNTEGWAGYVKAYELNAATANIEGVSWDAGDLLNTRVGEDGSGHDDRIIFTYDPASGGFTIPFRYSDLTTHQKSILSEDQVDYLRGDKSNEQRNGGSLRDRITRWEDNPEESLSFVLGDMVHSSPYFFKEMVYVGGNDGMLHAFLADGSDDAGKELFAYVPNLIFDNLDDLTDPSYQHLYFVDNTPYVREIDGMDLLVGGLGKGGKGYYALDVTTATNKFSGEDDPDKTGFVQWEFDGSSALSDVDDMGYSFGDVYIRGSNDLNHEGIVIFGNGYGSENGTAVLFVLDADGSVIKAFDTGIGDCDPDTSAQANGMSTPAPVDVNGDGGVDYIYAGDLNGNLWKFDLTSSNASEWDFAFYEGGTPKPLFQAMDADGNPQPITGRPDITYHCAEHGYMVIFGTGRYLAESDISDDQQQTVYGIWDYGDDIDDDEYLGAFERGSDPLFSNSLLSKASLLEQTSQEVYVASSDRTFRVLSANEAIWETEEDYAGSGDLEDPTDDQPNHVGWYYDLPKSRERVIQEVQIRTGRAIVVTNIPAISGGLCLKGSGESYLMEFDPCTGGRTGIRAFDVDGDGVIDDDDYVTIDNPDFKPGEPVGPENPQTLSVPPSGLYYEDQIFTPTYITGKRYITKGSGETTPTPNTEPLTGMIYWQQHME